MAEKMDGSIQNAAFQNSTADIHVAVTSVSASVVNGQIPPKDDTTPIQIDRRFGYGPCKPKCIQIFNKLPVLVLWLTLYCFLEGFAINGIANAGIPGIERQFKLTSSKSSIIPASQDIGSSGPSGPSDTCGGAGLGGAPPCNSEGEKWVGVFALAQVVHGIGFAPMFTLGTVYLDENASQGTAALCVGICYAATAIGVACGFFAGGQFMQNWFVDFDRVNQDKLGFDAMDTRWVGAWWLGFVFTTILFVVVAIPMFGYPKYMPSNTKAEEAEAALMKDKDVSCGTLVKTITLSFFKACFKLLKNPTFIFISLGGCAESLIIFGVSAFAFKYLAEMYNMGFDTAGLLLGGLILVGSVGMFLGGLLIRIFHLEIVGMLRLNVVATFIACVLGISYLAACPETQLAGLEVTYPNESMIDGYTAGCNTMCSCEDMSFHPVCGDDGIVYYSACHAGCSGPPAAPMEPYTNCSCVAQSLGSAVTIDTKASPGRCDDGCTKVNILAPCLFIMMISVLTATTPSSMATLRCVDDEIRPLALGIGWMLLRLLGSIPGPVLIASVIDGACKMWSGGLCGSSGVCLLYSKDGLSVGVLLWWVIVSGVACLLFFISSICAQKFVVQGTSYDLENEKKKEIAT
ncbi:solute carrier organic anion transporter family member 4A1-like isoform X2 [Mercenaria mercenaria]|uniref:solute carrier organic anion transporter family member 4A1-like isoform X2 n=1 Tax=Mercenaria mercenaria TaxID=6596 RepID=UPI00234ECFE0|nr:solute carrier organic anion transporter family member 4A1-like isoform X2 [Mercenaria mercenaria]